MRRPDAPPIFIDCDKLLCASHAQYLGGFGGFLPFELAMLFSIWVCWVATFCHSVDMAATQVACLRERPVNCGSVDGPTLAGQVKDSIGITCGFSRESHASPL